jgi:hypothetical protein
VAEAHLDHPGDVTWFKGHGPAPVLGPCPHRDCPHNLLGTVAWGPDYEHYTLITCDVGGGCAGGCRAWQPEWPQGAGPGGRTYGWPVSWKQVGPEMVSQ